MSLLETCSWSEHSSSGALTSCIWSATTAMNGGTNQENKPRDDELGISPPLFDDTLIDLSSRTLTSCSWSHLSNNNIAAEKSLANTSDFMINRSALPEEDPFISFTSCSSFVSSTPKKASEKTGLRKMEVSSSFYTKPPKKRRLELQSKSTSTHQLVEVATAELEPADPAHADITAMSSFNTWSFTAVTELNGCEKNCALTLHDLCEYDILTAHARFTSKDNVQQRQWLFDYFSNHCPHNNEGKKDPKNMKLILCGKEVCLPLWLTILSVSSSRFYSIRKEYVDGKSDHTVVTKSIKSPSGKSC